MRSLETESGTMIDVQTSETEMVLVAIDGEVFAFTKVDVARLAELLRSVSIGETQ